MASCPLVRVRAESEVNPISTGTGPEVRGCWNAPEAVVHAAIIYCLRALCAVDMPLNGGCLAPIDVRIPQNSFLSPSDTAAVCGGNGAYLAIPDFRAGLT